MVYGLVGWGVVVAFLAWLCFRFCKRIYAEASAEVAQRWAADHSRVEAAPWHGTTGLRAEEEQELTRYLRREFGEVGQEDGLKAADLIYLGIQTDAEGTAHFWAIPNTEGAGAYAYAYIDIDAQGQAQCYGWGGREPPSTQPAQA